MLFSDLKLLMDEDIDRIKLDIKTGRRQLMYINLSKLEMKHRMFPRLAQIVPREGDYGIFEISGNIVKFTGELDSKKVNYVRSLQTPDFMRL